MKDPQAQPTYQVRLGWGANAFTHLAKSRIVVVVDAIDPGGEAQALADQAAALPHDPIVFIASLRTATATAKAIYEEQLAQGGRAAINLVLVGHEGGFAVEDYLAAGAIADALTAVGLDHSSPEVAVATEGFRPLTRALKHLLSASETGAQLKAEDRKAELTAAAELDADEEAIRFAR